MRIGRKLRCAAMLARLREIAAARRKGWQGRLLELNGQADHVQLLIARWLLIARGLDLPIFVNNLKATSSRPLGNEFVFKLKRVSRKPVLWSRT
jgi:REP-associated tyrosine transposase